MATFGGSGSLLLCRLVDILDLPAVLVPPDPGNVSAFGLLTVDVKNDYVQTAVALHDRIDRRPAGARVRRADRAGGGRPRHRGVRPGSAPVRAHRDLRYFGQAFEVRVPVPHGRLDAAAVESVAEAFHAEHRALYGYDFSGDSSQQVEWVNLRVSGIGPIRRPDIRRHPDPGAGAPTPRSVRPVCFDAAAGYVDTPVFWRTDLLPGQRVSGPVVIEEYGSTVPVHPGFAIRVDEHLNLVVTRERR
jgi:N-methylhydantoinase A